MSDKSVRQIADILKKDLYMTKNSVKEKRVTVRLTNSRHSELTTYAKAHEMSLSQAIETLVDAGLKAEHIRVATKEDIELLVSDNKRRDLELEKALNLLHEEIKNQPIQIQPQNQLLEGHKKKKESILRRLFKS